MAFLFVQMIVLLAVLAAISNAFSPRSFTLKSRSSSSVSCSGRLALQMGSHGIYDVKSNNGVHSISFEVRHSQIATSIPAVKAIVVAVIMALPSMKHNHRFEEFIYFLT